MVYIRTQVMAGSKAYQLAATQLELSLAKEDRSRLEVCRVDALEPEEMHIASEFNDIAAARYTIFAWYYPFPTDNLEEVFDKGFAATKRFRFGVYFVKPNQIRGTVMKLLLCRVVVGRSLVRTEETLDSLADLPEGYQSVYTPSPDTHLSTPPMFSDTYVVSSGKLALPAFVIEFLFKEGPSEPRAVVPIEVFPEHHRLVATLQQHRAALENLLEQTDRNVDRYTHAVVDRSDNLRAELAVLLDDYLKVVQQHEECKFEAHRFVGDIDRVIDLIHFHATHRTEQPSRFFDLLSHFEGQMRLLRELTVPAVQSTKDKLIEELRAQLEVKNAHITALQSKLAAVQQDWH
eukprot:TRINITY_DN26709_c0_g1_i1.p1 TRINITY_DN26709_c0_g1~~TRINITY_DN26709_c0_g1_i1.p1  ORF type:complete len:347 (-),score=74.21 TRINITY_DN26709_c0_g1_i1:39-1079(-)